MTHTHDIISASRPVIGSIAHLRISASWVSGYYNFRYYFNILIYICSFRYMTTGMGTMSGFNEGLNSKTNSKTDLVDIQSSPRNSLCSKTGSFVQMSNNLVKASSAQPAYNRNGYLAVKQESSFV